MDDTPLPDEILDDEVEGGSSVACEVFESTAGPAQHGVRLDRALADWVPAHSRSHLQTLVEEGAVTVDGAEVRSPSRKLQAGQRVRIEVRPTAQSQSFKAEAMDLDVVFEDEHLLVVNKPAGMVVHPAAGNWQGTLMNGLLAHHAGAAELPRAGIVHRLDKDTSGLMVVAKHWAAMHALTQAIAAREVSRQYLALVHGQFHKSLHIDAPIGRDPVSRIRMAVVASGKPAQTDVLPVHICGDFEVAPGQTGSISAVRCVLHTGRTHQIRVHLSHRGHPLLGDLTYGGRQVLGLTRQALHAARLALTHPMSGQLLCFVAPLPEDLAGICAAAGWECPDFSNWTSSGA